LVNGYHVTGFLIIAAVGGASGLIQIASARPSRPLRAQRGSKRTEARHVQTTSNPVCCKPFVMEQSESNRLVRAYDFANASAASEAIVGRRNFAM
jgi:hypothetical protein